MTDQYDVAVIGGGFSGTAAAIAAAREGAKVILIEKSNCLGGAACNCLVEPFMPYTTRINEKEVLLSQGIFKEITENLKKMLLETENIRVPGETMGRFNEEHLKIVLNRMAIQSGVTLLFHSYLTGVQKENGKLKSVTLSGKSGSFEIAADYFIDATGDADLSVMSGYTYHLGRENDHLCQPMTLCFRLSNIAPEVRKNTPYKEINALYQKFRAEGKIKNIREDVLMFKNYTDGVIHFNSTRIVKLNPTDPFDLTKAEIEAREQVLELYLFMKQNIKGFENSQLLMTASEIGVRESRMIDGEYLLTGTDLKNLTQFEDSIALGNYDIDIHNPEGSGTSHYYFKPGEYYSIPYRCLIPKNAKNLLTAGRCISVDHDAQASIRIMPIVCTLGEAAGTAAAIACREKQAVGDINISLLRNTLKENGAVTQL